MKRLIVALAICILAIAVVAGVYWQCRLDAEIRPSEPLSVDGAPRSYRIVIPRRLAQPAPLVFAFHGIGDSPDSMAHGSQLDRLAAREGFILVYPAARKSIWAGTIASDESGSENPDVRFFDVLLAELSRQFKLDRQRVYLVGMSNGASFVQRLANERPAAVAAVVAHSGSEPDNLGPCENRRPIMLVVGQEDTALSAMTAEAAMDCAAGRRVELVSIPHLGHQWSVRHNVQMWQFLSQNLSPPD